MFHKYLGGDEITISGSGFGVSGVLRIGGVTLSITSYTDTEVKADLPALGYGFHKVEVIVASNGAAVDR